MLKDCFISLPSTFLNTCPKPVKIKTAGCRNQPSLMCSNVGRKFPGHCGESTKTRRLFSSCGKPMPAAAQIVPRLLH